MADQPKAPIIFIPLAPGTIITNLGTRPDVGVILNHKRTQTNLQLSWFEDVYDVHWLRRDHSEQNVVGEYGVTRT